MKLFGTTINETIKAFRFKQKFQKENSELGAKRNRNSKKTRNNEQLIAITRIIISLILLIIAGFLLYKDQKSEFGFGIIGLITGYWLK